MRRQRLPFPRDPYWLDARFPGQCSKCAAPIKSGTPIFYYPNSKTVFCDGEDCGKHEARQVEAALFDERMCAV